MHRRGALLPDRVDDREEHEPGRPPRWRAARGLAVAEEVRATERDQREDDRDGEHGPEHCDDERLEPLGGEPGRDRRGAPDDHHEHRDRDGRSDGNRSGVRPQSDTCSANGPIA